MAPKRKQEIAAQEAPETSKPSKKSRVNHAPRLSRVPEQPHVSRKSTRQATRNHPLQTALDEGVEANASRTEATTQTAIVPDPHATTSENISRNYWLMKAEPESRLENGIDVRFSIDDLRAAGDPEPWDGVRNHVAKNNMKAMKIGDLAFFYHSNCKVPGIAGIMKIVDEATIDESAFSRKHPYYDPKSSRENPRWFNVHVVFHSKFHELVTLKKLQEYREGVLQNMQLLKQSRLSVSKVSKEQWDFINGLVKTDTI